MNNPVKKLYVCPMHPEIVSDKPGRCPKCGMTLVPEGEAKSASVAGDKGLGTLTWRSYVPLMVIILLITAAAGVAAIQVEQFSSANFILYFMAGFFLVFSGFKLMDLEGFSHGYSTYDLLAQRFFAYGYIYPFVELAFGLLMLGGYHSDWLLWVEFGVMSFSGLGVATKIYQREPFMCACLGTFIKVPLTYVTLVEDFGMAILALILIGLN